MSNSTRLIGLIMSAVLFVGVAAGQGLSQSQWGDEAPPEYNLPLPNSGQGSSSTSGQAEFLPTPNNAVSSAMTPDAPFDGYTPEGRDNCSPSDQGLWYGAPAEIESTGTWLRRGFWYAEADAVVWNRMWNRDDRILAAQDPDVENPLFFFNVPQLLTTNRLLILNGANPGQDASVRATLGNFLFRDSGNRDHTAEFTVLGSGDWEQNRTLSSEGPFGLFVPFQTDGGNRSFDQSTSQQIDYSSHYSSFEGNYRVRARLGRDQAVMDANGNWHRAANHGFEREYLIGLRFMELGERLDWRAEDIAVQGADGRYVIHTDNDMFGFQLGTGLTYQAARWSLGGQAKGGVFVNDAIGRTDLQFTADDLNDANLRLRENELSFVGEFKLIGRYHVTPSVSLRAAYEMMYIEGVALAPYQATFITDFSYLNTTGDPFYHGASFGVETFW